MRPKRADTADGAPATDRPHSIPCALARESGNVWQERQLARSPDRLVERGWKPRRRAPIPFGQCSWLTGRDDWTGITKRARPAFEFARWHDETQPLLRRVDNNDAQFYGPRQGPSGFFQDLGVFLLLGRVTKAHRWPKNPQSRSRCRFGGSHQIRGDYCPARYDHGGS